MRLETFPLIVGIVVALIGFGFIADSWLVEDASMPMTDRRRRVRAERHRKGEAVLGLGILGIAAAFLGRDSWRYSNIAVIVGMLAVTYGALLNRVYLRELMFFRGPARRSETPVGPAEPDSKSYRIR